MRNIIRKILKEEFDSDSDWINGIPYSLNKLIFYSERSDGLYDNWSFDYQLGKFFNENGVLWANGNTIRTMDEYKLFDRYYLIVNELGRLIIGRPNTKLDTEMWVQKGYTIINLDEVTYLDSI